MPVGAYELAGTGTGDGLLGRDFLDQFKMTVDAAKGEVHAGPEVARRIGCVTMTLPGHGLQSHAAPAENRLSHEGQPGPGRAEDARLVGRDRHLQAPARGSIRSSAVDPARRAALRQRQHPHGPRPQQGAQGRGGESPLLQHLRELDVSPTCMPARRASTATARSDPSASSICSITAPTTRSPGSASRLPTTRLPTTSQSRTWPSSPANHDSSVSSAPT